MAKKKAEVQPIQEKSPASNSMKCEVQQEVPKTAHPMGLGVLGDIHNIIFERKFRWILESKYLKEHFFADVKFDYFNQIITFHYMNVDYAEIEMSALLWAHKIQKKQLPDEFLKFTSFDGCGNAISSTVFSGLSIVGHESDFSYTSSDVSTDKISVHYESIHINSKKEEHEIKDYKWNISFEDANEKTKSFAVSLDNRPNLNIEECEVSHLNATTWICGKGKWNSLKIRFNDDRSFLSKHALDASRFIVHLDLLNNNEIKETWILEDTNVRSLSFDHYSTWGELSFSKVQYNQPSSELK